MSTASILPLVTPRTPTSSTHPRRRNTKQGLSWALLAIAALVLVACTSPPTAPVQKPTTLHVKVWADWEYAKVAATKFEADHPGVKVQVDGISDYDYFARLGTTLESSDAPDVTSLQVMPGKVRELVRQGALEDLSTVWDKQELAKHYSAATVERYTVPDGKRYAVSTAIYWAPVVYYNSEIFSKLNIQVPEGKQPKLDEFLQWADEAKKAGYVAIDTVGISDEFGAAFIVNHFLRQFCGAEVYSSLVNSWDSRNPDTAKWADSCGIQAIETLKDWASKGLLGKSPAAMSAESSLALFKSQQAAMYISGSWETRLFAGYDMQFPYDWFLMPTLESGGSNALLLVDIDGLGVNAHSPNKELARQFVEMVSSETFQKPVEYWNGGSVPPRIDLPVPTGYEPIRVDQYNYLKLVGVDQQLSATVPYGHEINSAMARVLADEITPMEAAKALDVAVQEWRAKG